MADIDLNGTLADAVLARPWEFFVDDTRFEIPRMTLGMSLVVAPHYRELGIDDDMLAKNPSLEGFRIISENKDKVCYIMAMRLNPSAVRHNNTQILREKRSQLASILSDDDIVKLLLFTLSEPNADTLIEKVGLTNQQKRQSEIATYKNKNGNTITFGGLTIYGTLIAPAMEKLHISKDDVLWGIDLVSLRMLLADSINSVHLTDEDKKGLGKATSKEKFNLTQEDIERIKRDYDWS